jgi:phage shock protein C
MEEPVMSRCHRRRHGWRRPRPSISDRRLCRIPERGRFTGVCAGIAEYFRISRTFVRVATIIAACFNPPLVLIAYAILSFVLPTREEVESSWREAAVDSDSAPDETIRRERAKQREFDRKLDADEPSLDERRVLLRRARERLAALEQRLRGLEAYVTSRRFGIDREFNQL